MFNTNSLTAQTSQVVPNSTLSASFLGPFANVARTYQMLIDDSQLTTLSGKYLSSISFRLLPAASAPWPPVDATFSSYQIYLSDGADPANRQLNFAANIVGNQTQVKSGSLVIPAGSMTSGSDPNAFSYSIVFDTPYLYTSGNLIIEIRHTGSNTTSTSTQAVSSSSTSAGFGTLFSACWQGTGGVLNGSFTYVKINSLDNLSVKSVEIDGGFSVYPNPVKEDLFVKSARDVAEFHIFNMVGQKIYSQKNNSKTTKLNVSSLANGNYVLQMIDKDGNSKATRFIKE
ncbi:hypothetical protein CHRY9390_02214 [Chryseobacterium aquaeductus]|uniref:Secretion system C-terminal sorting domain-containing protein n=1 Tax=Chryseobacterium aquaeductus TaxID=2675056 RepID=A0A9N8QSM6_9FLAO|nr:T9SS type A sorting domain-containing protein [Chryseobacterium aquaeductus]CAA7331512.1 hypothetical protein CHRY9390_02214 [Chryseobacterium potabilaquae]CAD7810647.1 hypothetical protein CHRY9390_02214 [Chryseobacterium aquaeductus]